MSVDSESLNLTATLESLEPATEFVRSGALKAGLTGDHLRAVDLVIEELFMNVANHAYPPGTTGIVQITWSVPEPRLLSVEITDEGDAFDPLSREEPNLSASLSERPIGGLGVFLVRRMTSSLRYRRDGGRNRLRFEMSASPDA
jgi:anti-sigma regulatory factor (Ser/Thr protein kinase)